MSLFQIAKTTVKSLFSAPATLMYPTKPAKKSKGTRGTLENDINRCIFCGNCQRKCPCVAITVDKNSRTWELDRFRCVSCNCCVEVCPVKCLRMENDYTKPTTDSKMKVLLKSEKPAPAQAPKPVAPPGVANPRSQKPGTPNAPSADSPP